MATYSIHSPWRWRLPAALILASLITPAVASVSRLEQAQMDVKQLENATTLVRMDLARPLTAEEWPRVLLEAPPAGRAWNGPYVHDVPLDPWRRPYRLGPRTEFGTFGVYSVGIDGIDQQGAGDDISSWAGVDLNFPSRPPRSWVATVTPPALLLTLLALLGLYEYRHVAARRRRSRR